MGGTKRQQKDWESHEQSQTEDSRESSQWSAFGNSDIQELLRSSGLISSNLPTPDELDVQEQRGETGDGFAPNPMRIDGVDAKNDGGSSLNDLTGIGATQNAAAFVDQSKAIAPEWPRLQPEQRLKRLGDRANVQLQSINAFPIKSYTLGDLPLNSGHFTASSWTATVSAETFSKPKMSTDGKEAQVVYHEARHAEQYHRSARFLAGEGKRAKAIAAELHIPIEVAKHATKEKLKGGNSEENRLRNEGKDWYNSYVGDKSEYRRMVFRELESANARLNVAVEAFVAGNRPDNGDMAELIERRRAAEADVKKWKEAYEGLVEEVDAYQVGHKVGSLWKAGD